MKTVKHKAVVGGTTLPVPASGIENTAGAIGHSIRSTFVGVILLLVAGCGTDSGTNPEPAQQRQTETMQEFPIGQAGGTIQYRSPRENIDVTLTIPAGALDTDTIITVDHAQVTSVGGLVTGAVFEFQPEGLVFNMPVELSIGYSDAMIAGLTEGNLRIHEQEAGGSNWIPLLGTVDATNKVVTAEINGFSIFGLKTIPNPGGGSDPGGGGSDPGGGGTDPGGGGTDPGGGGTDPGGTGNATLAWLQANVFGGVCSFCHVGGSAAPMGVDWSTEANTCANVGRLSSGQNGTLREIESGRPNDSYVIWKVKGTGPNGEPIGGAQMPLGLTPLSAETIQNMEDWITAGTPGCTPDGGTDPGGGGTDPGGGGTDPGGGGTDPGFPAGSWMQVWNDTLQICTICHSATPASPRCGVDFDCPPKDVILTADNYNGVVDGDEVEPFDLDGSKLWRRVTDPDPDKRMPFGMPALNSTQLGIISGWILDGAPFCPDGEVCP